ncbi:MAG: hypothetical protein QXT79_10910 [Thermofilaceae archaeon]
MLLTLKGGISTASQDQRLLGGGAGFASNRRLSWGGAPVDLPCRQPSNELPSVTGGWPVMRRANGRSVPWRGGCASRAPLRGSLQVTLAPSSILNDLLPAVGCPATAPGTL